MSVMMVAFSVSQTAGPIVAVTKAAAAATDFFAVIDAPKPSTSGLEAPEISSAKELVFDSVTFACKKVSLCYLNIISFGENLQYPRSTFADTS